MFTEDDLIPVSALCHLVYCPRQCALMFIENIWEDNLFTIEGSQLHEKVHQDEPLEARGDLRIARSLRIKSNRLGLTGITDVVEFHKIEENIQNENCFRFPGEPDPWRVFIVEYKRGRLRHEKGFEVQLCAEALCLEEMTGAAVLEGAVFYGKPRRRLGVVFTKDLREETESAVRSLHELISSGITPPAVYDKKCESCSLINVCLPKSLSRHEPVEDYIQRHVHDDT